MDIHGSTVTLSHPGLILSPEHPWVNRHVIPSISHPFCRVSMGQNQNCVNPDPQSKIRSCSICSSTVSIHGPTMITSTQTSSFPRSIHSPTMISANQTAQTSSAQKPTAHVTSYCRDPEHRLMATVVPLPSSSHARPIQISLDTSLSSCGGTNCRLHKISPRLWLTLHDFVLLF